MNTSRLHFTDVEDQNTIDLITDFISNNCRSHVRPYIDKPRIDGRRRDKPGELLIPRRNNNFAALSFVCSFSMPNKARCVVS